MRSRVFLIVYLCVVFQSVTARISYQTFYTTVQDDSELFDDGKGSTHGSLAIASNSKNMLTVLRQPEVFKVHRPGIVGRPGTVSFESVKHPGAYLRYKNYRFRFEMKNPTSLFKNDATFIEERGPGSLGTSFQLLHHPGWYICHDFDSDVGLRAKKERANAKNFVASCMFKPISKKEFFIHGPGAPTSAVHTHKAVVLKQTSTMNDELMTSENDKCISIRFINKLGKPINIISSMKPEGYHITAKTFKLKTIFKHPKSNKPVVFYAQDVRNRDRDIVLNGQDVVSILPRDCRLPFKNVIVAMPGSMDGNGMLNAEDAGDDLDIGLDLTGDDLLLDKPKPTATAKPTATKATTTKTNSTSNCTTTAQTQCGTTTGQQAQSYTPIGGYKYEVYHMPNYDITYSSPWTNYGGCSVQCGPGTQTRTRQCQGKCPANAVTSQTKSCTGKKCPGPRKSNCTRTVSGNAPAGQCCYFPFIYQDSVYDRCIAHPQTGQGWCSTTPNFDVDRSWGLCHSVGAGNSYMAPPQSMPYVPPQQPMMPAQVMMPQAPQLMPPPQQCTLGCYRNCFPNCPRHCCRSYLTRINPNWTNPRGRRPGPLSRHYGRK